MKQGMRKRMDASITMMNATEEGIGAFILLRNFEVAQDLSL